MILKTWESPLKIPVGSKRHAQAYRYTISGFVLITATCSSLIGNLSTEDDEMLHLLDKISLAFGHTTRVVTLFGFYLVTGLIAAATLFALVAAPFEYSVSQDDLAMADVVSLALIALVVWCFLQRGRQSGRSWWSLIQRMAFTFTFATLLCLGALAALFGLSAYFSESGHAGSNLVLSGGYDDLLTYSLTGFL